MVTNIVPFQPVQPEMYRLVSKPIQHMSHNCTAEISVRTQNSRLYAHTGPISFKAGTRFALNTGAQCTDKDLQYPKNLAHQPLLAQFFIAGIMVLPMPFTRVWRNSSLFEGRCGTLPTTSSFQQIAIYSMLYLCLFVLLSMWDTKCPSSSSPIALPIPHRWCEAGLHLKSP